MRRDLMQTETQNGDAVHFLAEINERLKRMQPLAFDEMSEYEQNLAFKIALDNASLADVYEVNETHPHMVELRESEKQAEANASIMRAKMAGDDDIDELRRQVSSGTLGAHVAKSAFDKSRGGFRS